MRSMAILASAVCGAALLAAPGRTAVAGEDSPVKPALDRAAAAADAIVRVEASRRTYENTVGALDDLLCRLDTETNMPRFMAYVSTDQAEREAGQKAEEEVQNWLIEFGKREDIYQAVKAFAATNPTLEGERKRLLERLLRDFRRAGMELSAEQRGRLKQIEMEIARLGIEFEKNIREDKTSVTVSPAELRGVPQNVIDRLKREGDNVVVTMDYPTFNAVMDYCDSEPTREKVWRAYKTRGGRANVELLERILKLRYDAARLLGYASPADFEIEPRMAKTASAVREFYEKLRPIVRRKAILDLEEFTAAKREHTGDASARLKPWDQQYYMQYLLKTRYAVDSKKVSEYFPMERVIDGLFSVTQSLYGLEYRDATAKAGSKARPIWHPDVRLYEVWDRKTGEMLGEFYIDLHPRENKYSHAAQWGLAARKKWADGSVQRPLAALVCNFTKPTETAPSLLTHDEVETFFHEFGHCLHTILTEADTFTFAGTSVARDFVEAPSQMFENWVWDADVLNTFARHYKSGDPLPKELLSGMIRAKHLGSGLLAERQIYYGVTDLTYHSDDDGVVDTTAVANSLFPKLEQYERIDGIYYQAGFGHLVGYQAGYYGYMWSLVYAADMFQRFKELGMLSPEAGAYYRKKILARGGTIEEIDMVKDYLGREPRMDAFLAHLGLSETSPSP